MPTIPAPPPGYRLAATAFDVFDHHHPRRGEPMTLRAYVGGAWTPCKVDIAIGSGPQRAATRGRQRIAIVWDGGQRRVPFDTIALPEED